MEIDRYVARLDQLIEQAAHVEGTAHRPAHMSNMQLVDTRTYHEWVTSLLHVLRQAFGEASDHYSRANHKAETKMVSLGTVQALSGIARAARADIEAGMLVGLYERIAANVFDDLMGMAEYLLGDGYHLPAVALAGAVLEDTLRKLCEKNDVTWDGHSSISKLNTELYKNDVYDNVQWGQVEVWGKLRNKVDHGDFKDPADVDPKDVERMIAGIHDFIVKYLA